MAGLKLVIPTTFTNKALPVLPKTPVVLTSDSFNRADTAPGALGTTDCAKGGTPAAWVGGTQLHIVGNRMGSTGLTTTRFPRVNAGAANHRVEVRVLGSLAGGVVARAESDQNYYAAYTNSTGGLVLDKRVAGAVTSLATAPAGTVALGDYIALKASGSTLTAYVNSVEVLKVTDTSHSTATGCGVRTSFNDDTSRFDDFLVTDI